MNPRIQFCAFICCAILFLPPTIDAGQREVEVPSSSQGITRAARLTLPDTGPITHGVLLLPVAGPTGVDMALGPRGIYSAAARRLADSGIASLRVADRGVEGSGGHWLQTDLETRTADSAAALTWFRNLSEMRGATIGVLGISEGGAIALLLGASHDSPDFVIALSTPMEDGATTLRWQRDQLLEASQLSDDHKELFLSESDRLLAALAEGDNETVRIVLEGPAGTLVLPPYRFVPRDLEARIDFACSPWYRSQVAYDISDQVRQVRVPVLAVYGTLDRIIDPSVSAGRLEALLGDSAALSTTVRSEEGLNHLMMPAVTGSPMEYGSLPEILSSELWDDLTEWITSQ